MSKLCARSASLRRVDDWVLVRGRRGGPARGARGGGRGGGGWAGVRSGAGDEGGAVPRARGIPGGRRRSRLVVSNPPATVSGAGRIDPRLIGRVGSECSSAERGRKEEKKMGGEVFFAANPTLPAVSA